MPFSDLSDDILLEIAFCIKKHATWLGFAALNSRCRAAALSAWLAIGKKFITISKSATVKALKKPTKELMNAIRKVNIRSNAIIKKANSDSFGLNHLRSLIVGSTMLDTLCFTGNEYKHIPLITILNLLASLQTYSDRRITDTQRNQIRFLSLREISCFEDCSNISPMGLACLEVLHIYWQRWSDRVRSDMGRHPSKTTCEVLGKMIKAARYTLQSLKIDFSGKTKILTNFDIWMLVGDEGDAGAWKKLRKLRVTISIDCGSLFHDIVGTLEAIADIFPNLETLELMIDAPTYYDTTKYTPRILSPLSKLKSLHCLKLALDFERGTNDEHNRNIDLKLYNRCLHRRYAATQAIVNVCPLTRCYWKNHFRDGILKENNKFYRFVVGNESGAGKPDDFDSSQKAGNRVVKTKMLWWMEQRRKCELGDDLPCEVVGSDEEEYMTSDSDE